MEKLDNRFYTRVMVDKCACLMIIDDFSCNLISSYAVEKLGLSVVDHPCPYEIKRYDQLISVTKQVWVSFSLGRYKDSILFDVAHIDNCHLHLGNPWQSYRNVVHDPIKNYYRVCMERNHILVPMSKEEAQRSVDGLQDRVRNWLDEQKDIIEEEVVVDSVKELIDNVRDTCVQELEIENQEEEMVEIDVGVGEIVVIEFEESEEVQVMDALDPIDEEIELQDLNDHPWIFKDKIDRSHDEWYDSIDMHLFIIMGCRVGEMKAPSVDFEELWEMLVQRGYVEQGGCQEPCLTGYVYLIVFEFCRFVFDPGGNLLRFEVESFQEGGDDTRSITLHNSSKRVKNEVPFKFQIRRLLLKIGYKIGLEVKM